MLARLALVALLTGAPAAAQTAKVTATETETVAVPALDYIDGSGEPGRDRAAMLAAFAATLRTELAAAGLTVVEPACATPCSPARTPFAEMSAASAAAGAPWLLAGAIRKVSTLIGTVTLTLIDLPGDRVICTRTLSYRGDTAEAWQRAAQFGARDVVRHCLG